MCLGLECDIGFLKKVISFCGACDVWSNQSALRRGVCVDGLAQVSASLTPPGISTGRCLSQYAWRNLITTRSSKAGNTFHPLAYSVPTSIFHLQVIKSFLCSLRNY